MLRIGGQKVPTPLLLLLAVDCLLIAFGLVIATGLRLGVNGLPYVMHYLGNWQTLLRFLLVIAVCEVSLYFNDLYDFRLMATRNEILVRLLQAFGIACVGLAFSYYLAPDLGFGRGIAALAAPLIVAMTLGWRLLLSQGPHALGAAERMLIMGTGPTGISLARVILSRPELQLKVVGFLDEKGQDIGKSLVNPGIIGAAEDVEDVVRKEKIDHVVISLLERRGRMPVRQLLHLKFAGVKVEDAHAFYERMTGRIILERLSPSWLILSDGFRKSMLLVWAKRAIDVVVSAFALALCTPLFIITAVAIWLETGSPVLFRQERTGLHGRRFQMLKFRSMRQDAEEAGPQWAAQSDHRITRVGRWIRKYRIDELPQFLNVLRGEMSIVGPRPERPEFVSMLEEQIPFFGLRHSVRPGITGWAQVRYQYGSSVEETVVKLEHDLFYIKHLSIMLDLAVLFETAKVMLSGRGAK
ncbi:MAG TPA: TIGR03013 family XrtA/PEP-CTERM system glycosyltransferase [Methylomirabilota bacterium]|nr:TIGR03013 family XrtA/PEP-CTERM system glycosyltransferase [Methylomirabilota bacterium]